MKFIDDFKYMIKDLVNPESTKAPIEEGVIDVSLVAEFNPNTPESKIKEIAEDFKSIFNKFTNYKTSDVKSENKQNEYLFITYDLGNERSIRLMIPPNYTLVYLPTIKKQKFVIKNKKLEYWAIIMKPHRKNNETKTYEPIKFTLWEYLSEVQTFYPISQHICDKYNLQISPPAFTRLFIEGKPAIEDIDYPRLFKIKYPVEDRIKYEISKKQDLDREEELNKEINKNVFKDFGESNIPGWGDNCFGRSILNDINITNRETPENIEWLKQVEGLLEKYNIK